MEKGEEMEKQATAVLPEDRDRIVSPVISVSHLTKDYKQGRGIFDVSFDIGKGECFGFLGPNGAGKSTTIRHLMGFSIPDSGTTLLRGQSSLKNRSIIMQGIGYVPGEVALPDMLKGSDVIKENLALKGVKDPTMLNYLMKEFQVDDSLFCREMSLGTKRKIAIVIAFCNDPDIIILDEPSSGLDPTMQDRFISFILEEKKRGKTILLSSHIFSEVDSCCDRIAIIKDGRIVSRFHADDLRHKTLKQYHILYPDREKKEEAEKALKDKGYRVENSSLTPLRFSVFSEDRDINKLLTDIPRGFTDFSEKKETLEDYFMTFYKEDKSFGGIR
jgi:ABC-2 type transport system ATP-binding protein